METKYMMATKAIHQLGDISRDEPDLCVIFDEDADNYIGNWVEGFGFCKVKFPKSTTRELTTEEVEKYHGGQTMLGDGFGPTINIKGEDFHKKVTVTKEGTTEVRQGTLTVPLKVGRSLCMVKDNGETFYTSTINSIDGNKIVTRNSVYVVEYL